MTQHVPHAHSPSEMRLMSNVGHWVEGAIIYGAGGLLLAESTFPDGRGEVLSSRLLTGAGALLGLAFVGGSFQHGGPAEFFKTDHQQREHLQMAGLLTAGGLLRRAGWTGRIISAAPTARIDQMFLTHEQDGTGEAAAEAKGKHERLGKTILAAAAVSALGELLGKRLLRAAGAALLLASGVQLILYREPDGAYEESA